jgi:uncharacterized protein with PQ loop repeat
MEVLHGRAPRRDAGQALSPARGASGPSPVTRPVLDRRLTLSALSLFSALFGVVAVSLSVLTQIPQVLRALRTRVTDGLSTGTLALSLLGCSQWCAYGFGVLDLAQITNNLINLVLLSLLGHALVRAGAMRRWHGPALLVGSIGLAAAVTGFASPMAAAAVATTIGLCAKVPQVRIALSGAPLWGLDPWTVLLGCVSASLWIGYGLSVGDAVVVGSSALSGCLSGILVWRRLPPRRTLWSLAEGRLGPRVARAATPISLRFPQTELTLAA